MASGKITSVDNLNGETFELKIHWELLKSKPSDDKVKALISIQSKGTKIRMPFTASPTNTDTWMDVKLFKQLNEQTKNSNKPNFMVNNLEPKKTFFTAMLSLFLCFGASQLHAQKVYVENNGIVMMEAENTESSLGEWIVKKDFPLYSGNGYLEFSGGVVTGMGSPSSPLTYTFKITNSGDYGLQIRGRSRLLEGETVDLGNDAWFKLEGDYSVGTGGPPDTTWTRRYTKLFVGRGGNGNWGWGTKYDIKHVQPSAIFNLKAGETYTLTMAGRSQRFNVDRILITSIANPAAAYRAVVNESSIAKKHIKLEALTHFSNIDVGKVSFYKDARNNALAINATVISNRGKFAIASTVFNSTSGTYDVTLTTLAEFDGESTYHFLVNSAVVGTFKNPQVKKENDYALQTVSFKAIAIKANDTIAVASNTHTNGLIPEGTGTAWARGRWRSIVLEPSLSK